MVELWSLEVDKGARTKKVRLGRGESSGCGKTCGKGNKGQSARTGYSNPAGFEGGQMPLYRRLPKRGFTSRKHVLGLNTFAEVDVMLLENFEAGTVVGADELRSIGCKGKRFKILGSAALSKAVTAVVDAVTAGARSSIEAAGGSVRVVGSEVLPS